MGLTNHNVWESTLDKRWSMLVRPHIATSKCPIFNLISVNEQSSVRPALWLIPVLCQYAGRELQVPGQTLVRTHFGCRHAGPDQHLSGPVWIFGVCAGIFGYILDLFGSFGYVVVFLGIIWIFFNLLGM